jgi:uridine kinase
VIDVDGIVSQIRQRRAAPDAPRTLLVAVSGSDCAGKGYIAHQVGNILRHEEVRVAVVEPEAWVTSFEQHRAAANPAEHYYQHALQYADLSRMFLEPLKETGTVRLTTRIVHKADEEWIEYEYELERVQVAIVESVFLLKREYRPRYDLAYWIECGPDTALQRALARSPFGELDDGLEPEYRTIRWPAQAIHQERDEPKKLADGVLINDPRLV